MFWKFGTIGKDICKDTCKSLVFFKIKVFHIIKIHFRRYYQERENKKYNQYFIVHISRIFPVYISV